MWRAEGEFLGQRFGKAVGTAVVVFSRGGLEIAHDSSMVRSFSLPGLWLYRDQRHMGVMTGVIYRLDQSGGMIHA